MYQRRLVTPVRHGNVTDANPHSLLPQTDKISSMTLLLGLQEHTSNALISPPHRGPCLDFHLAISPKFHIALALSMLGTILSGLSRWQPSKAD
jgi:hypothetical protein